MFRKFLVLCFVLVAATSYGKVNARRFGAIPNDGKDDTVALQRWLDHPDPHKYLPRGVYEVEACRGIESGLHVNGKAAVLITGDGPTSVIKRRACSEMARTSPIVWMEANKGIEIAWEKLRFDGNEQNCPYDPNNPYGLEQSASVKWKRGSGFPRKISFHQVSMINSVADGYHANIYTEVLDVRDWESFGRTRRVRADIQLSRLPLEIANVSNVVCDAFEFEANGAEPLAVVNLSNMLVRGAFDLASKAAQPIRVQGTNIVALCQDGVGLPITNFHAVKGRFNNCVFRNTRRIQNSAIVFDSCDFICGANKDGITRTVSLWHTSEGNRTEMLNCSFDSEALTDSGIYVNHPPAMRVLDRPFILRNCRTIKPLEHFVSAGRTGSLVLDGGEISATKSIISIAHGGGDFVGSATIRVSPEMKGPLATSPFAVSPVPLILTGFLREEDKNLSLHPNIKIIDQRTRVAPTENILEPIE